MSDQRHPDLTRHLVQRKSRSLNLKHRFKIHEVVIQASLFACGLLSIFTTIGIILVLGNESLSFFTRDQWVNTNRAILSDMDENDTVITVEPGKALEAVEAGGIIRVGQEVLEVVDFQNNHFDIDVMGTGGGFKRWCATDAELAETGKARPLIINASRPAKHAEIEACAAVGISPIAFRVGTDALAIVVSSDNGFVSELTFAELQQIFGEAETWSDVRAGWPDEPIQLVIPGEDSGTFDFFVEEVLDGDPAAMLANDPIMSENDNQLVGGLKRNAYSIGFFGYAYYLGSSDDLNIISLDGATPAAATVDDGSYSLSRPFFIYSDAGIMRAHPQVKAFISYYLERVNEVIVDVGYFQASTEALAKARNEWIRATDASAMPLVDPSEVSGELTAAGSSTVFLLTARIAELFVDDGYLPRLTVKRGIRGQISIAPHRGRRGA